MNIKEAYTALSAALPEPWAITCAVWSPEYKVNTRWEVWSGQKEKQFISITLAGAVAAAIEAHQPRAERFEPGEVNEVAAALEGLEEVGKENQ
jgi:hypothetical protein